MTVLGVRKRHSTKSVKTRERLKDAARLLFEQLGHAGVSAKAITDSCALSTAVFFRYYKGKREILLDICKEFRDELTEGLRAEPVGDSVYEIMCEGQYFYLSTIIKNWEFYRALLAFSLDEAELRDYFHVGRILEGQRTADRLQRIWTQSDSAGEIQDLETTLDFAMTLNAMTEGSVQDLICYLTPQTVPSDNEIRARARFIARTFYRAALLSDPTQSQAIKNRQ